MAQSQLFTHWNTLAEDDLPDFGSARANHFFRATWKALQQAKAHALAGDEAHAHQVMNDRVWSITNRELPALANEAGEEADAVRAYLAETAPGPSSLPLPERRVAPKDDPIPAPESAAAWRERGKAKYYRLQSLFEETDDAHATHINGEILRDLDGKPVKAKAGTDPAQQREYYHTVTALTGRKATRTQPTTQYRASDPSIPYREIEAVHPDLLPKVETLIDSVNKRLPQGWRLEIFETYRSPERQRWCYDNGRSKIATPRGKHCQHPAEAVDVVFKKNGRWTWESPYWSLVDEEAAKLDGVRRISWDKPHVELKKRR